MTPTVTAVEKPRRLHTDAQRRTAAYLVDLAEQVGRPGPDGRILLPTALAELSARSGRSRNCGTLYAHIRALKPAVSRPAGQSGLLLDVAALTSIVHPERPPGPQRPRPERIAHPHRPDRSTPNAVLPDAATQDTSPSQLGALCEVVRDMVGLVHRLIDLAETGAAPEQTVAGLQNEIRDLSRFLADRPRDTPRPVRDVADRVNTPDRREGGRVNEQNPDQNLPPSLPTIRDIRDRRETSAQAASRAIANDSPDTASRQRNDLELLDLVSPLVSLSDRANLVGLTDIGRLRSALHPYRDSQIRVAVQKTATMAKAGQIRSPVGWLITKARQGDDLFFPAHTHKDTTPTAQTPPVCIAEPLDAAADKAVTAMEADPDRHAAVLEELDRSIRASGPIGERILSDHLLRHQARVAHWRLSSRSPAKAEVDASR